MLSLKEFSLDIHVEKNIGNIVQVKLEKDHHNHPWFCEHIKVQTPSGDCFEFPCYWWLVNENEVMIREGTGMYRPIFFIIQFLMKQYYFYCCLNFSCD